MDTVAPLTNERALRVIAASLFVTMFPDAWPRTRCSASLCEVTAVSWTTQNMAVATITLTDNQVAALDQIAPE